MITKETFDRYLPFVSVVPLTILIISMSKPSSPEYEHYHQFFVYLTYTVIVLQLYWCMFYYPRLSSSSTNEYSGTLNRKRQITTESSENKSIDTLTHNNNKEILLNPDKELLETQLVEIHHPYEELAKSLEYQLLEETNMDKYPAGEENSGLSWIQVVEFDKGDFHLEVHRKVDSQFHFRLVVDMQASPATVFDFLSDISQRPSWDQLWEEAGIIEDVCPGVSVQFMRTKSFWPTASREALVVSFTKLLEKETYLNVAKSIDSHPNYQPKSGNVKMDIAIAGQIVKPDTKGRENMSRVVQIVDGNLNGWIPGSLVSMISTQAFPISMRKMNKILKGLPVKFESEVIDQILQNKKDYLRNQSEPSSFESSSSLKKSTRDTPLRITKITSSSSASSPSNSNSLVKKSQDSLFKSPRTIFGLLKNLTKVLSKAQPWLVAIMFLAAVYKKMRGN